CDSKRTTTIGRLVAGRQRSRPSLWTTARVLRAVAKTKYRWRLVEGESCHLCVTRRVRLDHESGRRRIDCVLRQFQPAAGVFIRSPANGPHLSALFEFCRRVQREGSAVRSESNRITCRVAQARGDYA